MDHPTTKAEHVQKCAAEGRTCEFEVTYKDDTKRPDTHHVEVHSCTVCRLVTINYSKEGPKPDET